LVDKLNNWTQATTESPSKWIQKYFFVPDVRDPQTGEFLGPGPIQLAEHQARIIDEALSKDENGNFKYSTIIYSAPKKSGKSALSSAVALYMAHHTPNSFIACLANDGKQSTDRLYGPIYTCFRLHRQYNGIFKDVNANQREVILPNYTKIEAVPCDAAGEAGSQPLATFFSELWGFDTPSKRKLFTEMTIPVTLYGKAIRWIESYAGFTGISELLESLYYTAVMEGTPHPDFMDLQSSLSDNGTSVVFVNPKANTFAYWDHERRMIWQNEDYYRQEAAILTASEFHRIHDNLWSSPEEAFIEESWWKSCYEPGLKSLPDGNNTPVVVGIDMAVSRDCAALLAVTRSPYDPDSVAIRGVRIVTPGVKGVIDQNEDILPIIKNWYDRWNIVCWAYDPKEMAKLARECVQAGYGWFKPFGQVGPRAEADKQLHDMILNRQVIWGPGTEGEVGSPDSINECLYKHITKAGANTSGDAYRLIKLANSLHIDGAVALSQATYMAMKLSIENLENKSTDLLLRLQRGEISQEEFSRIVRSLHPELKERLYDIKTI